MVQSAKQVAALECTKLAKNVENLPPAERGTHLEKTTAESVSRHAPETYQGLADLQTIQRSDKEVPD